MSRISGISALLALGFMLLGAAAFGAEDLKSVTPEELKNSPKQYWLTGVVFKDVLTALPAGEKKRIAEEDFIPFQTRALGTCYADLQLVSAMATLPIDREYLFRGTVLTRRGDFFVVVRSATASFEKLEEEKTGILGSVNGFQPGTAKQVDDPLNAVLAEAYKAYYTYAEEIGIDVQDLFNDDPRYTDKLLSLIGEATRTVEREKRTTAQAILNRIVLEILAARYGQAGAKPVETSNDTAVTVSPLKPVSAPPIRSAMPVAGQPPEFDASVFVLQSGVGKRPLPPPPKTNAVAVSAQKSASAAPVVTNRVAPVGAPKEAVSRTGAVRKATSMWLKQKGASDQAVKNEPSVKPVVPVRRVMPAGQDTNGLHQAVGR